MVTLIILLVFPFFRCTDHVPWAVVANESSSIQAFVVTFSSASCLLPFLRSALLRRILRLQANAQGASTSPEGLQASVWARTYRNITLKKAQVLHQKLQDQLDDQLRIALHDLHSMRDSLQG